MKQKKDHKHYNLRRERTRRNRKKKGKMNSSIILECQCYKNTQNNFIIKELAYASCNDSYYNGVYLFKPPHSFVGVIKDVEWTRSYHGFEWTEGVTKYEELESILKSVTEDFDTIYTKGLEKSIFLSQVLGRVVIDLNDIINKRLDQLVEEIRECPFHMNKKGSYRCAYSNALNLSKWLNDNERTRTDN